MITKDYSSVSKEADQAGKQTLDEFEKFLKLKVINAMEKVMRHNSEETKMEMKMDSSSVFVMFGGTLEMMPISSHVAVFGQADAFKKLLEKYKNNGLTQIWMGGTAMLSELDQLTPDLPSSWRRHLISWTNKLVLFHTAVSNSDLSLFKQLVNDACLIVHFNCQHLIYISNYILRAMNLVEFFAELISSNLFNLHFNAARRSGNQVDLMRSMLRLDQLILTDVLEASDENYRPSNTGQLVNKKSITEVICNIFNA